MTSFNAYGILVAIWIYSSLSLLTSGFHMMPVPARQCFATSTSPTRTSMSNDRNSNNDKQGGGRGGLFGGLKGMFSNFDDVVDDFVNKRMGAGEQWYGKRKSNPSGNFDGDYNGMGRSDYFRIEIARVQKEEMELRKQRRLAEEEERRRQQKKGK